MGKAHSPTIFTKEPNPVQFAPYIPQQYITFINNFHKTTITHLVFHLASNITLQQQHKEIKFKKVILLKSRNLPTLILRTNPFWASLHILLLSLLRHHRSSASNTHNNTLFGVCWKQKQAWTTQLYKNNNIQNKTKRAAQ